jgi:hypothetical protein
MRCKTAKLGEISRRDGRSDVLNLTRVSTPPPGAVIGGGGSVIHLDSGPSVTVIEALDQSWHAIGP